MIDLLQWDANRRAAAGARLLDREKPDWFYNIEPRTLDVNAPSRCVLKQVLGGYTEGLNMLGLGEGYQYGFSGCTRDLLREAWINEAAIRLATAGPRRLPWHHRLLEFIAA